MLKSTIKLVVFDWDGTLMDSEARIVSCLRASMVDLSLPARSDTELKNIIGLGLREAIESLFPDISVELQQAFVERYRYHFITANPTPSSLFDGAMDTVLQLDSLGYFLAVATGKGRRGLDKILLETGLDKVFHSTRCADETFSKPHPQMLEQILEELGVLPEEAVMVGDTEYDMLMARNAGVAAVGVSYGVHEVQRLQTHEPLMVINAITELLPFLESDH